MCCTSSNATAPPWKWRRFRRAITKRSARSSSRPPPNRLRWREWWSSARVAGSIGSWLADDKRMLGYWFGREFWGRGVATRALAELLPLVSDRPIFANVVQHNVASRRVLEKNGFAVVGEENGVDRDGNPDLSWILRLD